MAPGTYPVSSRRTALETLRKAVSLEPAGPILLTGEPGTGKTWLCQRLVDELAGRWGFVSVEMSEALDPLDFLRLIGEGLGIETGERLGGARVALARALEDDLSDGRSWMLVLENAQNATAAGLERGPGPGPRDGSVSGLWSDDPHRSHRAGAAACRPAEDARWRHGSPAMCISCPLDLDEACELVESLERSWARGSSDPGRAASRGLGQPEAAAANHAAETSAARRCGHGQLRSLCR